MPLVELSWMPCLGTPPAASWVSDGASTSTSPELAPQRLPASTTVDGRRYC